MELSSSAEDGLGSEILHGGTPPTKQLVQLPIAELCPSLVAAASTQVVQMPDTVISGMKVKLRKVKTSAKIWDSLGTDARDTVSVWSSPKCKLDTAADAAASWIVEVPVGCYCHTAVNKRPTSCSLVRVRDTQGGKVLGSTHINDVIRRFLPFPRSFRLVWTQTGRDQSLFVWRAVPPSPRFVALGHICTISDDPPDVSAIHCVPRAWTTMSSVPPKCVWTDAGTGGKSGSLWVNSMGLLVAVVGHELTPLPDSSQTSSGGGGSDRGGDPAIGWLTIKPEPFNISPQDDQPTKAAAAWRRSRVKIHMAVSLASSRSASQADANASEESSSSSDEEDEDDEKQMTAQTNDKALEYGPRGGLE